MYKQLNYTIFQFVSTDYILHVCSLPPTSLLPGTRYDRLAAAFGAKGYHATSTQELQKHLVEVLAYKESLPQILNVEILPSSLRKPQVSLPFSQSQHFTRP